MFDDFNREDSLIDSILDMPNAPLIVQKVNTALEDERRKREAFYNDITEQVKAEFINGEVIIHSPVVKTHNEISGNAYRILDAYIFENNLGFLGIEKILIQLTRNDYEPDICFFKEEKAQHFTDNQKFFPAPDLVVEVLSKSTKERDRGVKFQDYQAHDVEEYWIIDPQKQVIEQYVLQEGAYELILKSSSGTLQSQAVKGLQFPIIALFDRNENYKTVKEILATK